MDPNLFHLDWERVIEALATIIVIAFLVERALSLVFESRLYQKYAKEKGFKEFISLGIGVLVCVVWDFDAVSMVLLTDSTHWYGAVITGAVVAGGSKASIKLFRDVMKIRSTVEDERLRPKEEARKAANAAAGRQNEGGQS